MVANNQARVYHPVICESQVERIALGAQGCAIGGYHE
jgi:hypothetical protein